jgi:hypothetical protein
MRTRLLIPAFLLWTATAFANEIVLEPGDSVTINGTAYHCAPVGRRDGTKLAIGDRITLDDRRPISCVDQHHDDDERPSRRSQRAKPATHAQATTACNALSFAAADRTTCENAVLGAQFDATPAVAACINLSYAAAERLQCVSSATGARHDPTPGIAACMNVSYAVAERLSCVSHLRGLRSRRGTDAVKACLDVSYSTTDRLQCIASGVALRGDPAASVKKCLEVSYSAADRNQCVKHASAVRNPLEVISSCIGQSYGSSARLACLAKSAEAASAPPTATKPPPAGSTTAPSAVPKPAPAVGPTPAPSSSTVQRKLTGSITLTINGRTYTDAPDGELGRPCGIENNPCTAPKYTCHLMTSKSGVCVPR